MRVALFAVALILPLLAPAESLAQSGATFLGFSPPPGNMVAGQTYAVSVSMLNSGGYYWVPGVTKLGSQNPENNGTWGLGRVEVPWYVAPGETHTFNFTITAPPQPGTYAWSWRMLHENIEWFGDFTPMIWVSVESEPAADAELDSLNTEASWGFGGYHTLGGAVSDYPQFVGCRVIGRGAQGANAPLEAVRVKMFLNGSLVQQQTFPVYPRQPYDWFFNRNIGPSEGPRSLQCVGEQINRGGVTKVLDRSSVIPGNGPAYTEVKIMTFIPEEWMGPLPPALVAGFENHPQHVPVVEGDNRSFDYSSNAFRTRVWGWINNPAFDRNALRAATPIIAGESRAYDGASSLDLSRPAGSQLRAEAKADTVWAPPYKASWGTSDLSRVGCSEIRALGMQGNRLGVRIKCSHEANLPLMVLSPDIDWRYTIDFWFGDSNIFMSIHSGSCVDLFPSHELYVGGRGVVKQTAAFSGAGLASICLVSVNVTNLQVF